ncbi:hypothetical protein [Nocardioides sp. InS609-2]|uniref:hypothetical protein n=1 Tax=Nocardioides sp. InS609-2 TaxID=2760705 RepID=UPI0017BEA4F8|nr:hypothetical protein [Nocardioides sp. InS609-2]MBA3781431.1 hypothetical protein [Nocardioides sp.]
MTTQTSSTRRLARRASVIAGGLAAVVLTARPALADVPEGWSDPEPVSVLHALLLLGGVPLLLFVLIALAVYVPALARGEKLAPGAAPIDDEWFGGPRAGTGELTSRSADSGHEKETGGASGSW